MKSHSAARSGYGPAFLRRMSLHAANFGMALFCAAATFALWIIVAPGVLVLGVAASALFAFVSLMLATAAIPAETRIRPKSAMRPGRTASRSAPVVVKPPPVREVFTPAMAVPPMPALEIGNDLDRAYAALDAEWADLARIARQRPRSGRVLAA